MYVYVLVPNSFYASQIYLEQTAISSRNERRIETTKQEVTHTMRYNEAVCVFILYVLCLFFYSILFESTQEHFVESWIRAIKMVAF